MEGHNSKIGRLGEDLAGRFLEKNGYQIIDRNFQTRYGEIKTRLSLQYGYPEQAVDGKKINHLLQAAKIYLKIKNFNCFWRLDIISVELVGNREPKIEWFKDVSSQY